LGTKTITTSPERLKNDTGLSTKAYRKSSDDIYLQSKTVDPGDRPSFLISY